MSANSRFTVALHTALKHFYGHAEAAMKQQLAQVTVADVLDETLTPSPQPAPEETSTYRPMSVEQQNTT